MRKFKKLLLLIIIFIVLSIQPALARTVFYDTFNHWAENDINFTSNTINVFKGYGDFTFRPENNITRAEFITILARTAYKHNQMKEIYTSDLSYSDLSNKHWSYTFIISMDEYLKTNKFNLQDIFPGSNFYPDRAITREESSALIAAFCKDAIFDNPLTFTDVPYNNKYYSEIQRLANAGIIVGYENNTFRGSTNITRAEAASLIRRVYADIKTSTNGNYLSKLEFMPIKGDEMYSYFGNYDLNTTDTNDKKFIKAKDTLEYVAFGGYIFPEDSHLYDLNAVKTMESLRTSGYFNVAGTNYYMIVFGSYPDAEKSKFANEILTNVIARNDFKDAELMQIFTLVSKYDVSEALYMGALEKWNGLTSNDNSKANILFFRYAYYIKNDNKDILKVLIYEDLKKTNNIASLLSISFNSNDTSIIDFRNYDFGNYSFSLYKDTTLFRYLRNIPLPLNNSLRVVELANLLMIEKNPKPAISMADYENLFTKYSVNKLYVLNFLGEKERAFVEGMNDYDIIKAFEIYKKNRTVFDESYTGILKKVKE
ncbi:MAG: S-layer homology domain-containing protein [Tissierellia bacterium]|nr:S-layer homology domain-containing protein [Tissierellia bacterium]MDD3227359.1 S-layer homology domain-containing protein [Tissierellia bacterium]MDD3751008.1 S-layer homology domain-containing protein [Tissierellia bacterium]MDD4046503.1 S-layer homology domain-containing protein [Tissierellia bacterium]